jgi:exonuclease III
MNQGALNSYVLNGCGGAPGGVRKRKHIPHQSLQVDEAEDSGWIRVDYGKRLSRRKQEANWRDERSMVVWGVKEEMRIQEFEKVLAAERLYQLIELGTVIRVGKDEGRRVQITFPTESIRNMWKKRLPAILSRHGWHAVPSRVYAKRVEDRGDEIGPGVVDGAAKPPNFGVDGEGAQMKMGYFAVLNDKNAESLGPGVIQEESTRLRFATWNANSLQVLGRVAELGSYLRKHRVDLCACQETNQGNKKAPKAQGYRWFGCGEVGFFVSLALAKVVEEVKSKSVGRRRWLKIRGNSNHRHLYVGCVYMPQAGDTINADKAYAELENDCVELAADGDAVILGDFNAHCGKPTGVEEEVMIGRYGPDENRGRNGVRLMSLLRRCSARSMNCRAPPSDGQLEYTRKDKVTGKESVIDHVVVSDTVADLVLSTWVDPIDLGSDHRMVLMELSGMRKVPKSKHVKVVKWRRSKLTKRSNKAEDRERARAAHNRFQVTVEEAMESFDPSMAEESKEGAGAMLKDWLSRVEAAGDKAVGRKVVKKRYSQKWFDEEVKKAIAERREQYRVFKRSWSQDDFKKYRQLRKKVCKLVRMKKKQQWEAKMESIITEFEDNTKSFWSLTTELTGGRAAACSGPIRDAEGVLQTDEKGRSEALAAFYEALGRPVIESPTIRVDGSSVKVGEEEFTHRYDDRFREQVEAEVTSYAEEPVSERPSVHDREFSMEEVKFFLEKLSNGRATGGDGIPPEFLKYGGDGMVSALHKMFNWILEVGHTPEQWGKALVVLLYKKGDTADPGNYRGISLLDVVGKVFTRLVAKRIEESVKEAIVEEQAGFTDKRGCIEHIYTLYRIIQGRKKEGKDTYLFFLDVRKAFDTVWKDGLLHKLWKYGVRGKLWRVIKAMYADNASAILVDGKPSRWFKILQGVRQGDSASPCLFKIFTNDLAAELKRMNLGVPIGMSPDGLQPPDRLQSLLFADDIVLMAENLEDLQKMIDSLARYSRKWRFQENLGKCGIMKILAGKWSEEPVVKLAVVENGSVDVEIDVGCQSCEFLGEEVAIVSKYEYLGLLSRRRNLEGACEGGHKKRAEGCQQDDANFQESATPGGDEGESMGNDSAPQSHVRS